MGLDMYAYTLTTPLPTPVDFDIDGLTTEPLHDWRKHPNLHGWMEALYRAKGGVDPDFNCVGVQLTDIDLEHLELDIRAGRLPETCGFFFGQSDGSERDDDLAFIGKARDAIKAGLTVFYSSWW